jgi:hypothetical protein
MAGNSEAINEATLDLLERRIADRVTETARKRVIAYYVAFGSGISALAGLAGFAAVQWVKDTADHRIGVIIKAG